MKAPPMTIGLAELQELLAKPEGERLEFKEAKKNFHFETLVDYCAALANEGGGWIILGVTDKRPRRIVGTQAFQEPGHVAASLAERLPLRISCTELLPPQGRVLVFEIPARAPGRPIHVGGRYLSRAGDSLRAMPQDELREIFAETCLDYSAELHPSAVLGDLDPDAVARFRRMWRRKSGNQALATLTDMQLLSDAELVLDGRITIAALVLLGSKSALGRYLPQAEIVFEYRSSDVSIPHQQRTELRKGFLGTLDELWETVNLRNEVLQYRDGLFMNDIPVFNEAVVREAILNAVVHRDYRLPGSVFIRQFPRKLEVVSPGGFPPGITADNILHRQLARNRRIAEACEKCGLVERSGQGANRMFEESLREGKRKPDFGGTDAHQVRLTLSGEVQNPQFLRFLEKVDAERQIAFSLDDLLVLDALQREEQVSVDERGRLLHLADQGIVERIGKGKATRFVLSRKFYSFLGRRGAYTRRKGLDRNTQKALLERHIREAGVEGARLKDLQEVLKELSRAQIQTLLRELRAEGKVRVVGLTRGALWFPGPSPAGL
jgi:ATP-dependent DNA helicase RecG